MNIPRLAENADELYRKAKSLSQRGYALKGGRVVYPVINTFGDGIFQARYDGYWDKWMDGTGMFTNRATLKDLENLHDAIEQDTAQVEARWPWGISLAPNAGKVAEIIHSPRGNSFE